MPPTSLADWLRTQDDGMLAAALATRPDLTVPPPADLTVLATRAGVRASVHRAAEDLDTVTLAVLEALVVAGADEQPVTYAELAGLLGPDVPATALATGLTTLRARLLVWGDDTALRVVPAVKDVVPHHPGGLGRPAAGLAGSTALAGLLAEVDDEERRVLRVLADGPPLGRSVAGADPSSPVGRLLGKGLLVRVDMDTVELPRQVGLALRGDRPLGVIQVDPPATETAERGIEVVDRTAGGAVLDVVRHVELLIGFWGAQPPPVLRSGGLGVRELRRTAKEIGVDEPTAALLVETAVAADLIAPTDAVNAEWVPTTVADGWLAASVQQQWFTVVSAWLRMPRMPALVGGRDDQGRPIGPLSESVRRALAARDRREVLVGLAQLPEGTAAVSAAELGALLAWQAPRRSSRLRGDVTEATLREATVFGVVALGALSTPGRALLDDLDTVLPAVRAVLPEPVDHVLLQADLTAVAPGPLTGDLARELNLLADVESAGGATVYRFTEATIRRALDAGRDAGEIHELFATRSATPVPQGLTYLVDDVARRHGRLRGGAAASFLRAEDAVLVAEVMASPVAAELELRRIAPTVVVSSLPLVELLAGLRNAGFSPAAEDEGGAVLDLTERGRRTAPRRRSPAAAARQQSPEHLATIVERMRAGETLLGLREGATSFADGSTLDLLRTAAADQRAVWIGFVDGRGVAAEQVLEPTSVGGGVVEGRDRVHGGVRRVPLHRITSISLVD